jgi:hypothetical protein
LFVFDKTKFAQKSGENIWLPLLQMYYLPAMEYTADFSSDSCLWNLLYLCLMDSSLTKFLCNRGVENKHFH